MQGREGCNSLCGCDPKLHFVRVRFGYMYTPAWIVGPLVSTCILMWDFAGMDEERSIGIRLDNWCVSKLV